VVQRQFYQHWADLTHIDGAPRVLATDRDLQSIRPMRAYQRNRRFARNEMNCRGFALACSGRPQTSC
jgi:hypothetical protein